MKRLRLFLAIPVLLAVALAQPAQQPPVIVNGGAFPTGLKGPTPFPKIVDAIKSGRATIHKATAPPAQVITVPKRLSYWGNNQYGVCVTSESCFAIADYSTFLGMDEIFVTEAECISWARAHGWLNGAFLLDVIQDMQRDGIKDEKGVLRKAGTPSTVDYRNEVTLQSAIAQGPVSIAINADALPSGAGNKSGWYSFGGRSRPGSNHCVSLHGYGPTSELFKALGVSPPANAPPSGYLLFTWSTIGVVDHAWLMGTCEEAWVRNPTTLGLAPPPPPPPVPGVITVTVPNVSGVAGAKIRITPTASGGASSWYLFGFDYGDGSYDLAGEHAWKTDGSYKVTVTAVDSKGQLGVGTGTATIGASPPPPPPPPPTPGPAVGTVSWTVDGKTSTFELFPVGTRQKLLDLIGPMP